MFRLTPSSLMVRVLLKYPLFLPVYDLFKSLFFLRYVRVDFLTTRILVYRSFGPEVLQLKDAF